MALDRAVRPRASCSPWRPSDTTRGQGAPSSAHLVTQGECSRADARAQSLKVSAAGRTHELSRGCALGRWGPYLGFLPNALPRLPLFWPRAELPLLAGTAALDKLAGARALPGAAVEPPAEVRRGRPAPAAEQTVPIVHTPQTRQGARQASCIDGVSSAQGRTSLRGVTGSRQRRVV